MFKIEKKLINVLSLAAITAILFFYKDRFPISFLIFLPVPLYFIFLILIESISESRERVDAAVSYCINESEFNVIDKVEQLRLYFKDTKDVINYLSVVDSRLLAYVFDENNFNLNYKEYLLGAIRCLAYYNNYAGTYFINLDSIALSNRERVTTLLSSLYLISKQINKGANSLYIYSKRNKDCLTIDVIDQDNNRMEEDLFSDKLFSLFSSDSMVLSRSYL